MCGIGGAFNYQDNVPLDTAGLLAMRDSMRTRGPDGAGIWVGEGGHVGLVHRRLAILDLSEAGAQPMWSSCGRYAIVFNGEVYNYRALRSELETKGCVFRGGSDTEVLLQLFRLEGWEFVRRLRGMYAFAIWDSVSKSLTLGRDPLGIKPLYFSDDGKTVRFASQVKALLAGGGIDSSPSAAGWVGFYLWGHVPEPFSVFRGVRSLEAGQTVGIERDGVLRVLDHARPWDALSLRQGLKEDGAPLHDILLDSVKHHMVSDVPVGVFLSAGIDSSVIGALAVESGGQDTLRTVTLGFDEYRDTPDDETVLAKIVSERLCSHHVAAWIRRSDFDNDLGRFIDAMDQPTTDGVNTWFVAKAAAEAGLKVALSGVGGDELFGGYPSFSQIPRSVKLLGWCPSFIGRGWRWLSAPALKRLTSPKYAGLLEYGGSIPGAFLLRRGLYMPWELPDLLDADMVREGWRDLHTLSGLANTIAGLPGDHCRVMALESDWYMKSRLLRDTDWTGMAHSLEIRTPFVDVEVIRRMSSFWLGDGVVPSKKDLARVPLNPLPDPVVNRPKTGFSVPIRQWMLSSRISDCRERGFRGWARVVAQQYGDGR